VEYNDWIIRVKDYLKSCLLFQRTTSGDVLKTNKFSGFGFRKDEEFREKNCYGS